MEFRNAALAVIYQDGDRQVATRRGCDRRFPQTPRTNRLTPTCGPCVADPAMLLRERSRAPVPFQGPPCPSPASRSNADATRAAWAWWPTAPTAPFPPAMWTQCSPGPERTFLRTYSSTGEPGAQPPPSPHTTDAVHPSPVAGAITTRVTSSWPWTQADVDRRRLLSRRWPSCRMEGWWCVADASLGPQRPVA